MSVPAIKCWQCVELVPTASPWCPNCGADLLNPRVAPKKKRGITDWGPKVLTYIAGGMVIALLVKMFLLDSSDGQGNPQVESSDNGNLVAIMTSATPGTPVKLVVNASPQATPGDGTPPARISDSDGLGDQTDTEGGEGGDLNPNATPEAGDASQAGKIEVIGDAGALRDAVSSGKDEDGFIEGTTIQVILDTSGSMEEPLEESTRILIAKRVLTNLVNEQLPEGTPLMMRVYGNEGNGCDTRLSMPLAPLDADQMAGEIDAIQADNDFTPLAESIRDATRDMRKIDGPKIVVLLTDGLETCDGDPRAAVRSLIRQVPDAHLNIIGFGINDPDFVKEMKSWAKIGNGAYFDADDEVTLTAAIESAVLPPFEVQNDAGDVVASGVVGGEPVSVPVGTYRVVISMPGNPEIENVRVRSKRTTKVDASDADLPAGTPSPGEE